MDGNLLSELEHQDLCGAPWTVCQRTSSPPTRSRPVPLVVSNKPLCSLHPLRSSRSRSSLGSPVC